LWESLRPRNHQNRVDFEMLASSSLRTFQTWRPASASAIGNGGSSAGLRAIALALLLLGALVGGLWAGMNLSFLTSPADRGVMDAPY
jgi:hypothetical protein